MVKNKRIIITIFSLVLLLLSIYFVSAQPTRGDWYGRVLVDGTQVNSTSVVEAFQNGANDLTDPLASDTVGTPDSGWYLIHVPQGHASVYFTVDGVNASSVITFSTGNHELNLSSSKASNGASCTYSRGCINVCCSGGTEITDGSATGTCASACTSGTDTGGGGGSGGSSSGGGGGGGTTTGEKEVSLDELPEFLEGLGVREELTQGDSVTFEFKGEVHTVTITRVFEDRVLLTINSEPFTVTVSVGETKRVDVDGDGINDLSINLVKITGGTVELVFEKLIEQQPEEVPEEEPEPEEEVPPAEEFPEEEPETPGEEEEERDLSNTILVAILILVIIGVVIYSYTSRKKQH